ncbi:hypothetical protein ACF1G0_32675, partial [Streptomyces sp. NPDC013953]|uniref:hypothetical protein n=1 Tax=Streptomyces sp. NPDC013953 TaxID=3364868 RepID=UPI0036F9DBEC
RATWPDYIFAQPPSGSAAFCKPDDHNQRQALVQRPIVGLRPAKTMRDAGMEPGYPLEPRLDLLNRQLIGTQIHQGAPHDIRHADAVAGLG